MPPTIVGQATTTSLESTALGIRDLCARAGSDPEFAERLLNNPEEFREEFHLTDHQVGQIKVLFSNGLLEQVAVTGDHSMVASGSYY
jgi:hypothetical protein